MAYFVKRFTCPITKVRLLSDIFSKYHQKRYHSYFTAHIIIETIIWVNDAMFENDKTEFDSEMTNLPEFPSDFGPNPFIIDMQKAARQNDNFRTTLWTGDHLQVTLMNIPVKGTVGLEVHSDLDQFLRVEEGLGLVQLGTSKLSMDTQYLVFDNYGIFVPAGIWHNIVNIGNQPLRMTSVYAPPHYEWGTVHPTKADSIPNDES